MAAERAIDIPGGELALEDSGGPGPAVVLLHGLTATRRYVVMGSRALERAGHRVVAYDARGHGRSAPAAESGEGYTYRALAADAIGVLDALGIERAVLAGASMGAHTLLRVALEAPERVAGLLVMTPAHLPGDEADERRLRRWDALSRGLRTGGVEGFLAAYGEPRVPEPMRPTVLSVIRQRLALHEHPSAVADALGAVPRSVPFASLEELGAITVPVEILGSNDEADPEHPFAVAEAYAEAIPGAELIADEPGRSPRAWQGSQVSARISGIVERAGLSG